MQLTATLIAALFASSAIAAPWEFKSKTGLAKGWKGDKHDKYGKNKKDMCDDGPFKFTSTYNIIATPDQVINGTTPTGGLPVSFLFPATKLKIVQPC